MRTGLLIAASLFALAACGGDKTTDPGDTGETGATGATGTTGPTGSTSSEISVQDNKFSPSSTTVPTGTSVSWTWTGINSHNVTFDTPGVTGSATQANGGSFSKQFNSAGTFPYHCSIHGAGVMSGTIKVQ
jgi:plastocyanin